MSNQSQTSKVSFERVCDFLNALFPDPNEIIRLRAFAAKGRDAVVSARSFTATQNELMTLTAVQDQLIQTNEERGLYFVVNSGGDSDTEIHRYNAFFAENDDLPIDEQHARLDSCPLLPAIRVETLKSVHAYWLIRDYCSEQDWRDIQQRLIDYFDADEKIKNPSRLMRLPYFDHLTYDAEQQGYSRKPVNVALCDKSVRYTVDEMQQAFGTASALSNVANVLDLSTWDALNAEAARRIRKLNSKVTSDGVWLHAKGVCHKGEGNKALYLNLDTGAYGCFAGCDTATILRSLELPQEPQAPKGDQHIRLISSWRDFSQEQFPIREKVIFELEPGEVGLLFASTDVGKTTLSLNLSLMLATGGDFQPLASIKQGGRRVLYIDGETRKSRLQEDVRHMMQDLDETERALVENNLHLICDGTLEGDALDLANSSHRQKLAVQAAHFKPEFMVIDTMSALFSIRSENDNAEVSQKVMSPLAKLATDTGAAILLVHHIGKQSEDSQAGTKAYRGRGASVIGARARLVLMLKQDSHDESLVSLTCAKAKGRKFADVLLRLNNDTRWFTNTGKTPVRVPSAYERVIETVREFGCPVKRNEIDNKLKDVISESQIGKHLKTAVDRNELIHTKRGYYSTPENAQVLNAIDYEQMSRSQEGVPLFQSLDGANAHSLAA
jgi:hypothetical protein